MCVDEEQFACKAVSMCGTNCVLLDTHLEEMNKTNTIKDTSCVGYSRIYTDGYQMFPGQIDRGNGTKLANISTVEVCAARCDNYIVFNCQSFEYCEVDKNCWLHKVHGFDVTSWNNASENCVHYSRNFLSSFPTDYRAATAL
ncbi:PREDICTED: uncharacterized protein LOC106812748 [Priapulus caudatus]|uniref:Uncharacterized protein LOC106812748 n=1 Tax=Priapulus caudatus TaxID=37621 RepID=A0ABM1EJ25_PRICU|nr:PREDICTED: uncharacterized protein LOC106812748 [Priapulus caudatus]